MLNPSSFVFSMSNRERLVGGGRVEAVGPPALVEQAVLEQRLAIEEQSIARRDRRDATAIFRMPK